MPNNFKTISLKKNKTVEVAKIVRENDSKIEKNVDNKNGDGFVDDKKKELENKKPIKVSTQTL